MTTETKTGFTPGPWRNPLSDASDGSWGRDRLTVYARDADRMPTSIADVSPANKTPEEADANANLIAAAPALYEALEHAEMYLSIYWQDKREPPQVLKAVRAALALARGDA